jgi:hypothetical protein
LNPRTLVDGVSNIAIFHSGTVGNNRLTLGGPRLQIITEVHAVLGGGVVSTIWIAHLVGIRICLEGGSRHGIDSKTEFKGVLDVPKNPLHRVEMRLMGYMHVQAHLL